MERTNCVCLSLSHTPTHAKHSGCQTSKNDSVWVCTRIHIHAWNAQTLSLTRKLSLSRFHTHTLSLSLSLSLIHQHIHITVDVRRARTILHGSEAMWPWEVDGNSCFVRQVCMYVCIHVCMSCMYETPWPSKNRMEIGVLCQVCMYKC